MPEIQVKNFILPYTPIKKAKKNILGLFLQPLRNNRVKRTLLEHSIYNIIMENKSLLFFIIYFFLYRYKFLFSMGKNIIMYYLAIPINFRSLDKSFSHLSYFQDRLR